MIEAITAVATEKIDAALRRCSEDFPNKTGIPTWTVLKTRLLSSSWNSIQKKKALSGNN